MEDKFPDPKNIPYLKISKQLYACEISTAQKKTKVILIFPSYESLHCGITGQT